LTEGIYNREYFESQADFFADGTDKLRTTAEIVVPLVIERVKPRSVVDLGCGNGTWLETFARHGVDAYLGIDGEWAPERHLHIPRDRFLAARLDKPLRIERRFDLAISLEVAEHLPERAARRFVQNIVQLAPCVLFSAAIPHQRGFHHLNEQWPDYWARHFAEHGYLVIDGIRPLVWSNPAVVFYYRQNILMFARPELIAQRPLLERDRGRTVESQLSLAHPELMHSIASHPREHVLRPSARELLLSELVAALPFVAVRSFRWRLARLLNPRDRGRSGFPPRAG
jgi:SAM-dependent methyltransferase